MSKARLVHMDAGRGFSIITVSARAWAIIFRCGGMGGRWAARMFGEWRGYMDG